MFWIHRPTNQREGDKYLIYATMSFCRRKTGLELLLQTFWLIIRESKTQTSTNQLRRYTRDLASVYRIVRPYLWALPPHSWMLWASFFMSLIFSVPRYVMNEDKTVSSQCRTDMVGATWLSGAYKSVWFSFTSQKKNLLPLQAKRKVTSLVLESYHDLLLQILWLWEVVLFAQGPPQTQMS